MRNIRRTLPKSALALALSLLACVSLPQLKAQTAVAVVTADLDGDLVRFAIDLDVAHAPRNIANLALLAEPGVSFFRAQAATAFNTPTGNYVPAQENGALLPGPAAFTITANDPFNPTLAGLALANSSTVALPTEIARFSAESPAFSWSSSNAAFDLFFNPNIARFMLRVDTRRQYIDTTNNIYSNAGTVTTTNPSSIYTPSDGLGTNEEGIVSYQLIGDEILPNILNPNPERVDLIDQRNNVTVASFTSASPGQPSFWNSNNPAFTLSLNFSNGQPFFIINEDVSLHSQVTTENFYDNSPITITGGSNPFLSLGSRTAGNARSPGWLIQNEMIDAFANSLFAEEGPWGNRFATVNGLNVVSQPYAVAFANTNLVTPNTAGGEILVTGALGNPDFRGRHTHIGTVRAANYFPQSGGIVSGSRIVVQQLLAGGIAPPRLVSIEVDILNNLFNPIEFLAQDQNFVSLPSIIYQPVSPELRRTSTGGLELFTNTSSGTLRSIEASSLDSFPPIWSPLANALFPPNTAEEIGFDLQATLEANQRAFFRVNPAGSSYPEWPAVDFINEIPNSTLNLRGRVDEIGGGVNFILSAFALFFNADGDGGTLVGNVGDLTGEHELTSVSYRAVSPYEGELECESPTLDEPLFLRIYFDAHNELVENSGSPLIHRFHRMGFRERFILPSNPEFGTFLQFIRLEYGVWQEI